MHNYFFASFLILSCFSSLFSMDKEQVLSKITAVSNKIINETSFDLENTKYSTGQGVERIDFTSVFKVMQNGHYFAHTNIKAKSSRDYLLGFSYSGNLTVWINNQKVLQDSAKEYFIKEYTYDWFHFNKTLLCPFNEGENSVWIEIKNTDNPVFFMRALTEENTLDKDLNFENPLDINSPHPWLLSDDFSAHEIPFKDSNLVFNTNGDFIVWQTQPDFYIKKLKIPDNATYKRDPYSDWHYANGCTLFGLLAADEIVPNNTYVNFVEKYTQTTLKYYDYFSWQYHTLNCFNGSYCRLFRLTMLDDSGGPALPVAEIYKRNPNPEYQKILDPVTDYMLHKQQRLSDSTFSRPEPENNTLWADDLFMSVPYLLRVAAYNNQPEIYDEVARQIISFHKYLYDKKSGLYYHCWFDGRKEHAVAQWGRANGWIVWSLAEALKYIPASHKNYKKLLHIYQTVMCSIIKYQDESGLWHQLIDKDDSYLETSCSAMFTLALARGINNGWLSSKYKKYALKGWQGVNSKIDTDGTVHSICRGTGVGYDLEFYYKRATFDNDPRGLGAVLTAGAEIYKLLNRVNK